ncbi:MAG: hypothetical protein LPK02_07260 [Rhodobacterales bacterium]|nr:hypothetical protein [Rhodobacterales bacterium]
MTVKSKLDYIFPTIEQVAVLKERGSKNRLRSMWLGVSQMVLNLPRIMIIGLFVSLVQIVIMAMTAMFSILLSGVLVPLMAVFSSLVLGFAGRLADADSDEAQEQETDRLVIMMDLSQARKLEGKGEKTAD